MTYRVLYRFPFLAENSPRIPYRFPFLVENSPQILYRFPFLAENSPQIALFSKNWSRPPLVRITISVSEAEELSLPVWSLIHGGGITPRGISGTLFALTGTLVTGVVGGLGGGDVVVEGVASVDAVGLNVVLPPGPPPRNTHFTFHCDLVLLAVVPVRGEGAPGEPLRGEGEPGRGEGEPGRGEGVPGEPMRVEGEPGSGEGAPGEPGKGEGVLGEPGRGEEARGRPIGGLGAQVNRDFGRLAMDTSCFLRSAAIEAVEWGHLGARGGREAALSVLGCFW